jgi:phytoene dehydrogenase-like protein
MTQADYDAIVFGSGAGGMTCALTLAQQGARTLLVEKNDWTGGYAHGSGTDGFYWDHGGHIVLAYKLGMPTRQIFERLGIDRRIEMVPDRQDFQCVFPDESMELPADLTVAAEQLALRFPAERDNIVQLFQTMEQVIDDFIGMVPTFRAPNRPDERRPLDAFYEQFQRPWLGDTVAPVARALRLPGHTLLRYQNRTFSQLLDEFVDDPMAKAYLAQMCIGIGTPPSELSVLMASLFLVHALQTMWMPQGGFGALIDTMVDMFKEAGGEVVTGAEVARVTVVDGRATGVETVDGRTFTASAVVCASDARRLYAAQLPASVVPRKLRRQLPKLPTTPSFFQVQLGIDLDLNDYRDTVKRLNFIYPYPDIDRACGNFPAGNVEEAAYYLYVATFHQPEMAPPGMHSIKLECPTQLVSGDIDWDRDKEAIADVFIRRTEALIPGLRDHILVRRVRTPLDMVRDTRNADGAFAGWAFTPEMLSRKRPAQRTPVPGLYLAGQWTRPAAGLPGTTVSGYNTAGMVLADTLGRREWVQP